MAKKKLSARDATQKERKEVVENIQKNRSQNSTTAPINAKDYRKKYTTMLDPVLIKKLKQIALNEDVTAADVLENILLKHFK